MNTMTPRRANVVHKLAALQSSVDARLVKTGFNPDTCRSNFKALEAVRRGDLPHARKLFDEMPHKNTVTKNLMISSYAKQGNILLARHVFDGMTERTAVSWTILITAYAHRREFSRAFSLFVEMQSFGTRADHVTFTSLLSACPDLDSAAGEILQLHGHVIKSGCDSALTVCNSLIDSYSKTRRLDFARQVFDEMPQRDPVTFNALISGYSKYGFNGEAVKLFLDMQRSGCNPSDFTFAAILCAGIGLYDVAFGEQVHASATKTGFLRNVFVGNALLDFYSKHDRVAGARRHFDEMPELDCVSYNIVISGHAWEGELKEATKIFRDLELTSFDRTQFPYATMLSLAGSASNAEMGRQIHSRTLVLSSAETPVGNALVDMYAKCGKFEEAARAFSGLANKSTVSWTALISGLTRNGLHEEAASTFNEMRRHGSSPDQATFATALRAAASLASARLGRQFHSALVPSGLGSNVFCGSALVDMYAKCGSVSDAARTFGEVPVKNAVTWNAMVAAYAQNGDSEGAFGSFQEMVRSGLEPDSVSFLAVLTASSHCGLVEKGKQYFESMTSIYNIVPKREHYAAMIDVLCR